MAKKLYPETDIQAIADAIRAKNGSSDTYTVGQMASAIQAIPSGGGGVIDITQIVNKRKMTSQTDSDVAMFFVDGVYDTDYEGDLWTYTAVEDCMVVLDPSSQARTNTGNNEGYFAVKINDIVVYKKYLTSGDVLVSLSDLEPFVLSSGDVMKIVFGFDNEHTNCYIQVYTAISILVDCTSLPRVNGNLNNVLEINLTAEEVIE